MSTKNQYSGTVKDATTLAKKLVSTLRGGEVIALYGPLGSGKTTFTKALAKLLKFKGTVTSPTFTLMQTYKGKLASGQPLYIHHLDLYRLSGSREAILSGITEHWGQADSISLVEWADKAEDLIPKDAIRITFNSL